LSQRGRADLCHRQFEDLFKDSTTFLNKVLHFTVYPIAFPQLFKSSAYTFSEIVFLVVHEGFNPYPANVENKVSS
jgi:hypothetical protein